MLQLISVTKSFAGQTVLNAVDWHLRPGERVGLCGENGAGKTTLLRLLAGLHEADAGTVQTARGTLVGYLPQDGLEHAGRTLFAEARSALDHLLAIEQDRVATLPDDAPAVAAMSTLVWSSSASAIWQATVRFQIRL